MAQQRHIIKRQVLQLDVPTSQHANPFSDRISQVHQQRIVPLLDRFCNELSGLDRIHRIESLTVDLGAINVDNLEEDFVAKLTDRLHQALSEQINRLDRQSAVAGAGPKTTSQLELLERFAKTGSLPWWADSSQLELLEKTLQHLIRDAAIPLARLMRTLAQDKRAIRRLVHHYDDGLLSDLAHNLAPFLKAPSLAHAPEQLIAALQRTSILAHERRDQIRNQVWWVILRVTSLEVGQRTDPLSFLQTVLVRVAAELGVPYTSLIFNLQQIFQQKTTEPASRLKELVEAQPQSPESGTIVRDQARLENGGESSANLIDRLQTLAQRLRPELRSQLLIVLSRLVKRMTEGDLSTRATHILREMHTAMVAEHAPATIAQQIERLDAFMLDTSTLSGSNSVLESNISQKTTSPPSQLKQLVETLAQSSESKSAESEQTKLEDADETSVNLMDRLRNLTQRLRPGLQSQLLAALNRLTVLTTESGVLARAKHLLNEIRTAITAEHASATIAKLIEQLDMAIPESSPAPVLDTAPSIDVSFSDTDELFIDNAGLVTLWPFLAHFFEHLGFLENKRFKDLATTHRAVGLLQYLVTEDPSPTEFLLPLNKLLCGLELTEVFDFGPPASKTEADECTSLLEAAITHASILKNMSVAGFRGTFLLRKGSLTTRDGAWLLRVERATHDIVLDRFPWSINWIKLPWMELPLRVEW